jgi:hypothetical protein
MSDRWPRRLSPLSIVLLPAGFLAWTIMIYGVNVPFWDQWVVGGLVAQAFEGTLSLADLVAQQNESRLVFPRLLFLGVAYLTGYDVRYEMWGSFGLACLVVYNVYRLGRLTLDGPRARHVLPLLCASALILSLAQWENWFWGIQLIVYVPIACVTSSIVLAYASLSVTTKFAVSALLATLSTFSYANGMVCWVIVLPVLVLQTWEDLKTRPWLVGCWVLVFAVNVGLYFWHYAPPPQHPSFSEALTTPRASGYFLALLGAPLSGGMKLNSLYQAIGVGSVLVVLFGLVGGYVWRHRHAPLVLYRTMGWLALGGYTLLSAGVATLGRFGLGMETALSSRYAAFTFPLLVSLVYLVPIGLDLRAQTRLPPAEPWLRRGATVLSLALILLHLATTRRAFVTAESNWRNRLQGKGALQFVSLLPHESLTRTMYPHVGALQRYAVDLDRHGLLAPGLRQSLRLGDDELRQPAGGGACGEFEFLEHAGAETYLTRGWAILPQRRRSADAVVLAYAASPGSFNIFDLVGERTRRADLARALRQRAYRHAGWEHILTLPQGSGRPLTLAAWAVDADTGQLCRLRNAYVVDAQGTVRLVAEGP